MLRKLQSAVVRGMHLRARTALFAAFVTCMLAALSVVSTSGARAETSMPVQGKMVWDLTTLQITNSIGAGGNTILWGTTTVYVTGNFGGTATDSWRETLYRTGAFSLWDRMAIPTTLDGKSGTVTMLLAGRAASPGSYWTGEWVILRATDGLEGLHGVGTWWTANLGYDFSGEVHFV